MALSAALSGFRGVSVLAPTERQHSLTESDTPNTDRGRADVSQRPDFLAKVIYGEDLQSLPERVAKGARLLDMRRPLWFHALDPDAINMEHHTNRILGADIVSVLWGDYLAGISQLDLPAEGPVDHGFTLPRTHVNERMWWHLTQAWRREIRARQENREAR